MLYLIGLGLNSKGISQEGLESVKKCKKIYLENYTVDFFYTKEILEEITGKKIFTVGREEVESLEIVDEARKKDVALLVYGSPLTATTHITLIDEAKKCGIKFKVVYSASILDAVAETGLQIYKFGKIASMPMWRKNFEPKSFIEVIKENSSINAHSLILVDIGLEFPDALKQLKKSAEEHKIELKKIIVCQMLGTNKSKILYKTLKEFEDYTGIRKPYCLIVPSKLHFVEKEFLEKI